MTDYKSIKYNISGADLTGLTASQIPNLDTAKITTGTLANARVADLPTSKITSGTFADARISASSVTAHVSATDLTPVRQDILTLGLKQAVQENSTKFNLTNSAITKFEADADFNLAGSTTIGRNASEYVSSIYTATTYNTVNLQSARSDSAPTRTNDWQQPYTGGWTGSITNDTIRGGDYENSAWHANQVKANYLYDLSNDFRVRIFNVHYSTGAQQAGDYTVYAGLITPDTSATAGASPSVFRSNEYVHSSGMGWAGTPVRFGDEQITAAYAATIGSDALTDNYGANTALVLDANNLALFWEIYNSDNAVDQWGMQVDYDASAHTLISKIASNAAFTSFHANTMTTVSNVPTAGRYVCFKGENSSSYYTAGRNASFSTTYASIGATDGGYVTTTVSNATGTALGTTNVPSSAVTDVSGVMLLKNNVGTNTLGTDVKVYFTADNSAWTEATSYADAGTFSTGIKMIKLGKTTCTQGSDVRWKVVYANQASGSKEAHIYGIGLNY